MTLKVHTSRTIDDAQPRNGDLLLFRGQGLIARAIGTAGRSRYTHAGMALVCHGVPLCLEMREFRGGRAVTLASQVKRFPGRIDLFTPSEAFARLYQRESAAQFMLLKTGHQYNYRGLWKAAWLHLPFIRWLVSPDMRDDAPANGMPDYCSQAVANAARLGGQVDPVPGLADRLTEPADLARSHLWRYACTLVP